MSQVLRGMDLSMARKPRTGWRSMGINMTRNPAGSLPIGLAKDGMPIGMQVIGRQREDEAVLDAMLAMERVFGFDQQASFPS